MWPDYSFIDDGGGGDDADVDDAYVCGGGRVALGSQVSPTTLSSRVSLPASALYCVLRIVVVGLVDGSPLSVPISP